MGYIGMLSNQNASVTKNCLGISTQFLVESVYIPNIDRYHRLIPMAIPKMKSCVTKKRAIMNILKIKKRTKEQKKQHQSVGTMPPPKKNGLNIAYLWNHQSAISRLAVTVVISHTSGSVSTIW